MSHATNIKVSRDDAAWEAEVKAEIPAAAMDTYRAEALKEIQKTAKLDGFRPGKAPEDAVLRVYGEPALLRAAAERAIQSELPEIFAAQKLLIVETPRVTTDEPVAGKPLAFTARAALAPEIKLPDYKAISTKHQAVKEDTSVTDEEHSQAMTHLRRERHRIDKIEAGTEPQKAAEESRAAEEKDLPTLDDAFVQSLGYPDAAVFSEALRKNIQNEKELRATEKRRAAILDELVKDSKISYPATLREYELDDMEERVKGDLAQIHQTFESYLTEIKKTREELRTSWKDAADKRAKVRLILAEIARKEMLEPDAAALEHELSHAKEHYKDASDDILRAHISHGMKNEMVLRFLEGLPAPSEARQAGNPEPVGHTSHDHS
ncbi:MAG: trigger factor [Patescibacteria group bacterium]